MRRILVVDDDPHICLAIPAWLQRYGFRVSIADGGVNGHPLQLVVADDTSTPSGNQVAAQELVQAKQVFGVIEDSSLTFGGAKYLSQQSDTDARAEHHLHVHSRPDTVTDANVHADPQARNGSTHPAADCRADSP